MKMYTARHQICSATSMPYLTNGLQVDTKFMARLFTPPIAPRDTYLFTLQNVPHPIHIRLQRGIGVKTTTNELCSACRPSPPPPPPKPPSARGVVRAVQDALQRALAVDGVGERQGEKTGEKTLGFGGS